MKKSVPSIWLRRLSALCLTMVLILSLGTVTMAADIASGADLRLTATEGTVALKNSSGQALSARDNMKLYSGYVLSTSAKSYAYVSLGSTNVAKLDVGTKVEVRKSGSQLELLVSAGKLFFHVNAPISSGESLRIRTSTTVIGIREASGLVEVRNGETAAVSIYDGQAEVTTVCAAAEGGFQTTMVAAGQTGMSLPAGRESWRVSIEELTAEDVPDFVAVELAGDRGLQQRVAEATGLPVDVIAAGAQDQLKQDEDETQEELDRIAEEANDLPNRVIQAPEFAAPRPKPDWRPDPDPTPEPPVVDYTVSTPISGIELQSLLNIYQTVTIASGGSANIAANEAVTVPADKTLTVTDGGSITNSGTLTNEGVLSNNGTLSNNGILSNSGTLTNNKTYIGKSPVNNNGGTSSGVLILPDGMETGADGMCHITTEISGAVLKDVLEKNAAQSNLGIVVDSSASVTIDASDGEVTLLSGQTLTISSGASLTVNGMLNNTSGAIVNQGTMSVTGTMDNYGSFTNSGNFTNSGTYTNSIDSAASAVGSLTNEAGGQITNDGAFYNGKSISDSSVTLINNGTITNNKDKSIYIYGITTNNGIITNSGSLLISQSSGQLDTTYGQIANIGDGEISQLP